MSKLYVPEGVWLVCSEGTSTQQLAVVSQSTVTINDGHLMATVEDKVKTDFGCKKGALLTAIAMALCAIAVAAFVVGTGGLGACLIIGAAGAAGAVGGGIIGRLMPCGCASCMGSCKSVSYVCIFAKKCLLNMSGQSNLYFKVLFTTSSD